jgi:hypothetical protein
VPSLKGVTGSIWNHSDYAGRSYLMEGESILKLLCNILIITPNDTIARQQALATVQKLSLRFILSMVLNFGLKSNPGKMLRIK